MNKHASDTARPVSLISSYVNVLATNNRPDSSSEFQYKILNIHDAEVIL